MPSALSTPAAAVIGAGFIGPVHIEALRRLGIPVTGILGSSPSKSKRAAATLGLDRGYTDLAEVLSDPAVSVVHIASPNAAHHSQALACLEAGKHVVCEKPLGMNVQETQELARAAVRHPRQICAVNYNVRFYPMALQARALVRSGQIGDVFHLQGSYCQDWLLKATDFNWRVLPEVGGELRTVGDIGTHWLDLLLFITGLEVESVFADLKTVHPYRLRPPAGSVTTFASAASASSEADEKVAITTEDQGSVLLRFKGGARGNLHVSQVTAGRKNSLRFEIAGSRHALAWDSENAEQLWRGSRDRPNELLLRDPVLLDPSAAAYANFPAGHTEGFPDTFKQLYKAVYADVAAGQPSACPLYATFADGHRELLLCAAIAESHGREVWVPVASE
jgi:predicted dehydrogenase